MSGWFLGTVLGLLAVEFLGLVALALTSRSKRRKASSRLRELQTMAEDLRKGLRLIQIRHALDGKPVSPLEPRFTGQAGEDLIISSYFGVRKPGFYVEAGAYDGVTLSNTYILECLGWRGLLVEPHPKYVEQCKRSRPGSTVVQAVLGPETASGEIDFTCADTEGGGTLSFAVADREHLDRCIEERCTLTTTKVRFCSLNSLLGGLTEKVDLLSLDVEGMELDALRGFDLPKYAPSMVVIEAHDARRDHAVREHLRAFGYEPIAKKGCNVFFVPSPRRGSLEVLLYASERF